jgi:hypothetical protein
LGQDVNAEFLQFAAGLGQGALVAGGDDQIASFAREGAGDGKADAAIGAGDQGEAAGKR